MTRKLCFSTGLCALALVVACAKQSANPTSPSAILGGNSGAAADGTTLKASAPVPQSPLNSVVLAVGAQPTLVVANSTLTYASSAPLTYKFMVFNAAGTLVYTSPLVPAGSAGTTSHTVTAALDGEQTYSWQARAEYSGTIGPWSAATNTKFVTPANTGYIKGNEIYDPLINGKTVGQIHGPVTFIPNGGVRLEDFSSYISYELPQTCLECEFSLIIGNIKSYMAGGKTKLFAMSKGYDDLITNEYRMTVEKRGDGIIAWRFIARDDQIDTEGGEREYLEMDRNHEYMFKATWQNNRFELNIWDAPSGGKHIYGKGKDWSGRGYEASPHVVFIGAPTGRSGLDAATVPGVQIRQVYVGPFKRPANANK